MTVVLFRILPYLLLLSQAAFSAHRILISRDGWFRSETGERFVALGGFHGNVLPISRLDLGPEELSRVAAYIWAGQKTDGQGHIDLTDASDETLRKWFQRLAADGV